MQIDRVREWERRWEEIRFRENSPIFLSLKSSYYVKVGNITPNTAESSQKRYWKINKWE